MAEKTKFISGNLFHIIKILELMKQPDGTSIEELRKELRINRRSVFRLLKIIEQKLSIPFTTHRASFGGTASYILSPSFIEKLSGIKPPESCLTFNQALFVYLILKDESLPHKGSVSNEIDQLRNCLEALYNQ
jgi:hypothetical protein